MEYIDPDRGSRPEADGLAGRILPKWAAPGNNRTTSQPTQETAMIRRLILVLAVLAISVPAFGASEANCKAFVDAMKKASKIAGKEMSSEDADFWKKQCGKKTDEEVTKDTTCLNKAKTDKDVGACMK
jgi:hypothetical protein